MSKHSTLGRNTFDSCLAVVLRKLLLVACKVWFGRWIVGKKFLSGLMIHCCFRTWRFLFLQKFSLLEFHFLFHAHFLQCNIWIFSLSWFINHFYNSLFLCWVSIWKFCCCWRLLSFNYWFLFRIPFFWLFSLI